MGNGVKYQNMQALEKHLKEAFPHHLAKVYLVASPFDRERRRIIEKIGKVIERKESTLSTVAYETSQTPLASVLEQLNTKSILGGSSLVVLEGIERLKKNECELLAHYVENPSPFAYLILGGAALKGLGDLYRKGSKELVILDLGEEKPWDRERRLKEDLLFQASAEGKRLKPDVASYLLELIGPDLSSLEQELSKLICYVGERHEIERGDVCAISSSREKTTGWQLAETLVWTEDPLPQDPAADLSFLLALIGQLRYHLELGAQFQALLELGLSPQQIAEHLPQVRPAVFERFLSIARRRSSGCFKRGLSALFELELGCKNNAGDPLLLFDLFTAKLRRYLQGKYVAALA